MRHCLELFNMRLVQNLRDLFTISCLLRQCGKTAFCVACKGSEVKFPKMRASSQNFGPPVECLFSVSQR